MNYKLEDPHSILIWNGIFQLLTDWTHLIQVTSSGEGRDSLKIIKPGVLEDQGWEPRIYYTMFLQ